MQQGPSKRRPEGHHQTFMTRTGPEYRTTDSLFIAFTLSFHVFYLFVYLTVLMQSPSILPVVAVVQGWVVGFTCSSSGAGTGSRFYL